MPMAGDESALDFVSFLVVFAYPEQIACQIQSVTLTEDRLFKVGLLQLFCRSLSMAWNVASISFTDQGESVISDGPVSSF